eukprot:jgi/Mesen1/4240/ME000022S03529
MASGQQSGSLKDVLSGQAAFTLDFFKKVLDEQPKEKPQNLAVSPVSITLALSLVAGGAKGETLSQIVSTLKLPKDDIHAKVAELQKSLLSDTSANGGPTINFANRCYFDTSGKVKPEYTSLAEKQYGAPPGAVPFEKAPEDARKEINMWVSERTSAKVKELLPVGSVEHATRVIVANALYFKGAWATKFDPAQTKDGDFHLLDGSATPVPLMHAAKAHFGYAAHPGLKVLRLPYAAGGSSERQLAMYVLLPEDVKGLTALEKGLAAEQLQSVRSTSPPPFPLPLLPAFRFARLPADDMFELARIADEYGTGELRLTVEQNIIIPHVPDAKVEALLQEPLLQQRFPVDPHMLSKGLVACTGNQFCGQAIIETKQNGIKVCAPLLAPLPLLRSRLATWLVCRRAVAGPSVALTVLTALTAWSDWPTVTASPTI